MNMIEKMARAFLAAIDDGTYTGEHRGDELSSMTIDGDVDLIACMRAALMAMREPDEAMVEKCRLIDLSVDDAVFVPDDDVVRVWEAMIDAALNEKG
jgi:hypothetical protein